MPLSRFTKSGNTKGGIVAVEGVAEVGGVRVPGTHVAAESA